MLYITSRVVQAKDISTRLVKLFSSVSRVVASVFINLLAKDGFITKKKIRAKNLSLHSFSQLKCTHNSDITKHFSCKLLLLLFYSIASITLSTDILIKTQLLLWLRALSHLKVQSKVPTKVHIFVTLYTFGVVGSSMRLQIWKWTNRLHMTNTLSIWAACLYTLHWLVC